MSRSFGLDFRTMPRGGLTGPPLAWLYLKQRYSGPMEKDLPLEPERIYITSHCDSIFELEHKINRLKKELDAIIKEARRKFHKAEEPQ